MHTPPPEPEPEATVPPEEIDAILDKYERDIKNHYASQNDGSRPDIDAVTLRLRSSNPKVINIILKHSGHLVSRVEFRKALSSFLTHGEISEDTAKIIEALPFDDITRKLIALDSAENASNFPAGLIIALIGSSPDVMESYLLHVKPEDTGAILRRWPPGKAMNNSVIRSLLASDDARILVPLLSAMRTMFPSSAISHRKRLGELEYHSSAAVRAWAKKLV